MLIFARCLVAVLLDQDGEGRLVVAGELDRLGLGDGALAPARLRDLYGLDHRDIQCGEGAHGGGGVGRGGGVGGGRIGGEGGTGCDKHGGSSEEFLYVHGLTPVYVVIVALG
ncbi:hypothetical protein C7C56_017025 [Massilia glaciei]|uniref:Uncharacterized protein n=1 Tax=Massilia glaciei TaxID=1524097 RepID=A0A2U2HI50_9BURK|nr:hypothetical protein C7C56_017025 [Massilia glaciei]